MGEVLLFTHRYTYLPGSNNPQEPQKQSTIHKENPSPYIQKELVENHTFSLNEELTV